MRSALDSTTRRLAWALGGIAAWQGLALIGFALVAHRLPAVRFGELLLVIGAPSAAIGFACTALSLTASRYVARSRSVDPVRAGQIVMLTGAAAVIVGCVVGSVIFASAPSLARSVLHRADLVDDLRLAALIPLMMAVNATATGCLSGLDALRQNAAANLIGGAVWLASAAFWVTPLGVRGVVLAYTLGLAVTCVGSVIALRNACLHWSVPLRLEGLSRDARLLRDFALPSAISSVLVQPTVWFATTRLVGSPGAYHEVALFQSVYRTQLAFTLLAVAMGQAVLPLLSDRAAHNGRTRELHRLSLFASWGLGVVPVIALMCVPEVLSFAFGRSVAGAALRPTVVLVMIAASIFLFTDGLARLIAVNDLMWWGAATNVVWAVSFLVLNEPLHRLGAPGTAGALASASVIHAAVAVPLCLWKTDLTLAELVNKRSLTVWSVVAFAALASSKVASMFGRTAVLFVAGAIATLAIGRLIAPRKQHRAGHSDERRGSERLRVAVIGDVDLDRQVGGVENYIRALSKELEGLGIDMILLNRPRAGGRRGAKLPPLLRLIPRSAEAIEYMRRIFMSVSERRSVVEAVSACDPDVVWQHDLTASWLAARQLARRRPVVLMNQTAEYVVLSRTRLGRMMLRGMFKSYSAVIGTSADRTPSWMGTKAFTIPNGVDLVVFQPAELHQESNGSERRRLYGEGIRRAVLCPSRWAPVKGVTILVRAIRLLEERKVIDPDSTLLVFAGNISTDYPDYAAAVDRELGACRSHIAKLGAISWPELACHYRSSDLVVIPSLSDAISLTALEAMASGAPVVASRVGGLAELIEDGTTGYLAEAGSDEALADAIARALTDDMRQLVVSAAMRVAQTYEWHGIAVRTAGVLRGVAVRPTEPDGEARLSADRTR